MTTKHVSVPREELEKLIGYMRSMFASPAAHYAKELEAILSRAMPSDDTMVIATTCKPVQCTKDYTEVTFSEADWERLGRLPEGTNLYAHPVTSVPRVVTDQAVLDAQMVHSDAFSAGHSQDESWRLALQYFATSLPAARVPDEITTHDMGGFAGTDERERGYAEGWNACRKAMLATAPQAGERG